MFCLYKPLFDSSPNITQLADDAHFTCSDLGLPSQLMDLCGSDDVTRPVCQGVVVREAITGRTKKNSFVLVKTTIFL